MRTCAGKKLGPAAFVVLVPVVDSSFWMRSAGILFGPPTFVVLVVGHTVVTLGLWPVHVVMTYYTIAKAKKLGPSAKLLSFVCLPIPLVLCPVTVIVSSVLVGLVYGFITPLVATFEAMGSGREHRMYNVLSIGKDGTWSVLKVSCAMVCEFTGLSYHYFMGCLKDFREKEPKRGYSYDIKLFEIPGCFVVALLGVLLDVPVITGIALFKAPIMLLKGPKYRDDDEVMSNVEVGPPKTLSELQKDSQKSLDLNPSLTSQVTELSPGDTAVDVKPGEKPEDENKGQLPRERRHHPHPPSPPPLHAPKAFPKDQNYLHDLLFLLRQICDELSCLVSGIAILEVEAERNVCNVHVGCAASASFKQEGSTVRLHSRILCCDAGGFFSCTAEK